MNAQIVKGLGGDVVFDPPQAGRPTVANVTLYKSSGTELEASAAAAQDQVNTTLGADAAAKATAVTVASTTGIAVRRVYLLANTLGQHEFVRVKAVDTATKIVTLARGLVNGYLTSDGFVSPRLSVAVSVADSATLEEGLYAEFVYTVAGVSHTVRRFFDIVLVKWPDVILPAYEFRDQVGGRMSKRELQSIDLAGFDFEDEIARATRDVRADILRMAYRPDLFMSFDAFKVPVAMRVLANWAEDGTNIPSSWKDLGADEYYNHRVAIYKEELKTALTNTRSYDPDQSGTVNQSERTARLGSTRISL